MTTNTAVAVIQLAEHKQHMNLFDWWQEPAIFLVT